MLFRSRQAAHRQGPIADVLAQMAPEGYWVKPGPGYTKKYLSTVWAIILLAQMGADINEDERIHTACQYLLDHALIPSGQFTSNGTPSGGVDCLQGNLCRSLLDLGCRDERLSKAFEWMARGQTGEGMGTSGEMRYFAYKSGPNFECGCNGKKPCAWGAVKVLMAFAKLTPDQRTPLIEDAIQRGVDFMFSIEPRTARWVTRSETPPNRAWWKFGFPVFYISDLLQVAEALSELGYGQDTRLAQVIELVREKQDAQARWALEYDYAGKTWIDVGEKNQPNKWVTLRALRLLKNCGQSV